MLKKYTSLLLIGLIINLTFGSFVFAQDKETRATQKIKIKVAKLGTGDKVIEVKFKDKTKIKGYITEIKENNFVLVSKKDGASTDIPYDKVEKLQVTVSNALAIAGIVAGGLSILLIAICATGRCEN